MNSAAPQPRPQTAPPAAPAPAVRRVPGFAARKGQRGYAPMKFLGSLRGAGTLELDGVESPVAYQLDLYDAGGAGRTASGVVEGALPNAAEGGSARLQLDGGGSVDVTLQEIDPEGAVFEVRGVVPARLSALL